MSKRIVLGLLLAVIAAGSAIAADAAPAGTAPWGGKKNFVSLDLGLIFGGARFERMLSPKLSVGVDAYWANSFIIFNELEAGLFARYYLVKGLYGELGVGYHVHSGVEDVSFELPNFSGGGTRTATAAGLVATTGVAVSPGLGWKFDPGKPGGFFIEPGVIVPITIGTKSYWLDIMDDEFGVSVGFVLFCGLGWSF